MANFIDRDESTARALLLAAGVRILRVDSPDRDAVLAEVLAEGARGERARIVAEPPSVVDSDAGMGAWHVNNVNEFETVLEGDGIVEFWTADGAVAVRMGAGDIMAVERAEHRYLPTTPQGWALRFGGGLDGELVAEATGRASGPWPTPR